MPDESAEQDHFLGMIDKLHVMNFSIEGAAILASMADAIRAALEKGQLLEQIIINQRNTTLQNSNPEVTLKKKKKKKRNNSIINEDTDVSQSQNTPHIEEENLQLEMSSEISIQKTNPSKTKSDPRSEKNLNPPHAVKVNNSADKTAPSVTNIKVVSPSFLVDSITIPNQHSLNQSRNYQSDNLTPYQFQYIHQTENARIIPNSCTYPLPQKSLPSQEPMIFDNINYGSQPGQLITNIVEPNYHLNSSISKAPSIHQESARPEDEQPVMPFPIIIKSEYKYPPPKPSVSSDMCLETPDSSSVAEVSSSGNGLEISQDYEVDSGNANDLETPKQQYNVYIDAGKDATEDEVRAVFKDLDIVYCKIILKPNYSFGFVDFSTEEDMKAALALTQTSSVGGQLMIVRPCHDQRIKRKREPSLNHSRHQEQRIKHKEMMDPKRSKFNARTESNAFPRDDNRYQRDRTFHKYKRNPVHHNQPRSSYNNRRGNAFRRNNARN